MTAHSVRMFPDGGQRNEAIQLSDLTKKIGDDCEQSTADIPFSPDR